MSSPLAYLHVLTQGGIERKQLTFDGRWPFEDDRGPAVWSATTIPLHAPTPPAQPSDAVREGCVGEMTPRRACHFLRRFKNDEKMLGRHEQWALDFAIAALTSTPAAVGGEVSDGA